MLNKYILLEYFTLKQFTKQMFPFVTKLNSFDLRKVKFENWLQVAAIVKIVSYAWALLLHIWCMKRGIVTSSTLSCFWSLATIFGILTFRSEINNTSLSLNSWQVYFIKAKELPYPIQPSMLSVKPKYKSYYISNFFYWTETWAPEKGCYS